MQTTTQTTDVVAWTVIGLSSDIISNLQIHTVSPPFDEPQLASAAIAALSRADAMGLLSQEIMWLDESALRGLEQGMARAGIGRTLQNILGLDLLARLLRISQSSARRYSSGSRVTPDRVADRLHFLAFVVGDLAGAYNDIGVRRWFDRKRGRLDGNTPAQALGDAWSPDNEGPRQVRELSSALKSSPAT